MHNLGSPHLRITFTVSAGKLITYLNKHLVAVLHIIDMKNAKLNIIYQSNQDIINATKNEVSVDYQAITSSTITANPRSKDAANDDKHKDKTSINNHGSVSGNGNGSVFLSTYIFHYNLNHCSTYGTPVQLYYPQLQPPPPPPLRPPSAYGNKRAVLIGITYGNTAAKTLKGSVINARCMKNFLVDKLSFPNDSICMLTEEQKAIPTKSNIQRAMRWLVEGCKPGDSLVFYFSGHGSRVKDLNRDEVDGYDEAICPVDYEQEGKILDDEINATIVRPLPLGVKLHALVDASFSGTIFDLPFMCRMKSKVGSFGWKDQRRRKAGHKGTKGGLAVCISACDDNENAQDKSALTYSFLQAMKDEPKLTYGSLLNAMLSTISSQQNPQRPQLSSSEKFDIYAKSMLI